MNAVYIYAVEISSPCFDNSGNTNTYKSIAEGRGGSVGSIVITSAMLYILGGTRMLAPVRGMRGFGRFLARTCTAGLGGCDSLLINILQTGSSPPRTSKSGPLKVINSDSGAKNSAASPRPSPKCTRALIEDQLSQ